MNRLFKIAVFYFVFTNAALCTTYYITSSGNDSNTGKSVLQAWRTVANLANTNFLAGDRIVFEGGKSFSGTINFNKILNGTAANPISITSFPTIYGNRAIIESNTNSGLYAENCSGLKITNLVFKGSGRTSNNSSGITLLVNLPGNVIKENLKIDSVEVSGYKWAGISIGSNIQRSGFSNVIISNCVVHDNGDAGIDIYGLYNTSLAGYNNHNVNISYCKSYNNAGVSGKGSNSGNGIVISFVDNALIEHCECYNNGWLNDYSAGGPVGIWCWESNNVKIQFNESHHNKTGTLDGGGFDLDGGTTNSIIQYNYSHNNMGPGYLIAQFADARTMSNNTIRYNISENDGSAIRLWSTGSNGGIQKTDIYNNTLYTQSGAGGISVISNYIYSTRIMNNIIQTTGSSFVINSNYAPDIKFYGNCYWSTGNVITIKWNGINYNTLEIWRNATNQEKLSNQNTGIQTDPMLVNPGAGITIGNTNNLASLDGYNLQDGSGLIDAGINLNSTFGINPGNRDFFGTTIPVGSGYEIGASEYENSSPVPVELFTFYSSTTESNVLLNWETKTEVNIFGFEIERTSVLSELKWEKIGFVQGFGNSNSPNKYSFTDKNLFPGNYLYRLKMIDNNGSSIFSKEISVEISGQKKFQLNQNYPNPFNPGTVISYQLAVNSKVSLKIYNLLGEEIETLVNEYQEAGFHSSLFTLKSSIPNGIYFYQLRADNFVDARKMLLIK
jgi:hypothetical protein